MKKFLVRPSCVSSSSAAFTKDSLIEATLTHRYDVQGCMNNLAEKLQQQGEIHDRHKLVSMEAFYTALKGDFKDPEWWNEHKKESHHLGNETITLLDVLEYIGDCVCAGMARSGNVYPIGIDPEKLLLAFNNTVAMVIANGEIGKDCSKASQKNDKVYSES